MEEKRLRNAFDVLEERGFIKQVTHEGLKEKLAKESVTFYIGFDPTADSLHVGHYVQLMAMAHMQKAGHTPIALIGGGTAMVGDPSDRTDMRKMLTFEDIQKNSDKFKIQMGKFLDFSEGKAIMANNAEWLLKLNYVDFIREIGAHFSVNRMLTADCFKSRLEKGLSFLEFNYMLMQSYDFLALNREYNCTLQLGGDDQWSNIIAGADLIRRKEQKEAHGMTFALLLTSEGKKMGKTQGGAVWLDADKTSPYDFYQYWRNVNDADVKNCFALLTFVPMDEVNTMCEHQDERMNAAKVRLAYEITKLVHSEEEAEKAKAAAEALFEKGGVAGSTPTSSLSKQQFIDNKILVDMMVFCGLTKSRGEGRRLIQGNGISLNDVKITEEFYEIKEEDFNEGYAMIKKGKKVFHKVEIV
jgi:tyrosyl-tRNA synthetase